MISARSKNTPQTLAEEAFIKNPTVPNLRVVLGFWRTVSQVYDDEVLSFLNNPEYPEIIDFLRQIELSTLSRTVFLQDLRNRIF